MLIECIFFFKDKKCKYFKKTGMYIMQVFYEGSDILEKEEEFKCIFWESKIPGYIFCWVMYFNCLLFGNFWSLSWIDICIWGNLRFLMDLNAVKINFVNFYFVLNIRYSWFCVPA